MNKILMVDLGQCTSEVLSIKDIDSIVIEDDDLIFRAPLLAGYGVVGINRLTIKTKSKASKVGGYFAHYQKCNGYDYIIIKNKSDKPLYLHIDKEDITIKEIKIENINNYIDNISNEYIKNEEVEIAYLGLAGMNKIDFSKIMFRINKSCGKNGLGKLMGEKNLIFISLKKHYNLIPYDSHKLEEINNKMKKNISNEDKIKWYDENNSCYGCILNCESTSVKKIMKNDFNLEEAKLINGICDKYGMDSITFSNILKKYITFNRDEDVDFIKFAKALINFEYIDYDLSILNSKKNIKNNKEDYLEELGFCKFLLNKNIINRDEINNLIYSVLGNYN